MNCDNNWINWFRESRIEQELSIPPQCLLELGLIELYENNAEEAKKWIKKAIKDYTGYLTENYVHVRAYAVLRELGVSTDKHEDPHRSEWHIVYE